jgi:predicted dehydrogenase
MERNKIRIGIIGLGLMGREFASSITRWCHLVDNGFIPVLTGICDKNMDTWGWYANNFHTLKIKTGDYKELLASSEIDAIYCAVPHNLHEQFYIDIINSGKHLLVLTKRQMKIY